VGVIHPARYVGDGNKAGWDRDMNSLVATHASFLQGLERRVVVSVADRVVPTGGLSVAQQEFAENMYTRSRCTTQLIIVDIPRDNSSDHCNDDSSDHSSDDDNKTAPGVSGARQGFLNRGRQPTTPVTTTEADDKTTPDVSAATKDEQRQPTTPVITTQADDQAGTSWNWARKGLRIDSWFPPPSIYD
jgi:hypothetical protein